VDLITAGLRMVGTAVNWPLLQATDLRGDNFLVFGLLLYLATLLPSRSMRQPRPPKQPAAPSPAAAAA
jgi:hypothetical protein